MERVSKKKPKKQYEIIPIFTKDKNKMETVIERAFLKYLQYHDYE